jgi:CHAD domain-containing protein
MKNNILNHHIVIHLNSIERNISSFEKNKKTACLHHLRVDIKKIKAILSFAEQVYPLKYDAEILKPLFKQSGKIRQIHIHIRLLLLFPLPPQKLIEQLTKKENSLTRQFIKRSSSYVRIIKLFKKYIGLPRLLPDTKTIQNYFKKEQRKANKIVKTKKAEGLHRYRAAIKRLMYVYNILPNKTQNKIELNIQKINKQQEELGDWHDTFATVQLLSHKHLPASTAEYFLKLKEKEKKQFNALLRSLKNNQI